MEEKQNLTLEQYINTRIKHHLEMINKHLGAIEELNSMQQGLVKNEQKQTKETKAGAEGGTNPNPTGNGYAYKDADHPYVGPDPKV